MNFMLSPSLRKKRQLSTVVANPIESSMSIIGNCRPKPGMEKRIWLKLKNMMSSF